MKCLYCLDQKGDLVYITRKPSGGYWEGVCQNRSGKFKFTFVEELSREEMPGLEGGHSLPLGASLGTSQASASYVLHLQSVEELLSRIECEVSQWGPTQVNGDVLKSMGTYSVNGDVLESMGTYSSQWGPTQVNGDLLGQWGPTQSMWMYSSQRGRTQVNGDVLSQWGPTQVNRDLLSQWGPT